VGAEAAAAAQISHISRVEEGQNTPVFLRASKMLRHASADEVQHLPQAARRAATVHPGRAVHHSRHGGRRWRGPSRSCRAHARLTSSLPRWRSASSGSGPSGFAPTRAATPRHADSVSIPDEVVCAVRDGRLLVANINEGWMDDDDNQFLSYIKLQWNRADVDRSGSLEHAEVVNLLRKMNITISRQGIADKIQEFDVDDSGELEFKEFHEFIRKFFLDRRDITNIIATEMRPLRQARQREQYQDSTPAQQAVLIDVFD